MTNEVKLKLSIEGGRVVSQEIDGVSHSLDGADRSAQSASASTGTLRNALAGIVTVGAAVALIHVADAVTTLRTSLNLSANSVAEATVAYERVFAIAQDSRTAFLALGDTYSATARTGKELGISQDRLLTVTGAIANSMTIGGGAAQSMQAALTQLNQGLASGTLRGDELNSILEQMPRLARAIAEGMGVSVGQLRSLGEQGKITSETIITALEKSAPQLAKEVSSATVTVSQGFTMVGNSATRFVGNADAASGASGNLASALQSVSAGVDTVGAAINSNQSAFGAIANGLASAAVVAGLGAVAVNLTAIVTVIKAASIFLLANPIVLAVAAIVGAGVGLASLASDWKKTTEGMHAQMGGINADIGLAEERQRTGSEKVKAAAAVEIQALKDKRDALRQTMALADQSSAENVSYNDKEMKMLQAKVAAEQSAYSGAKPLDEVRKFAKLRNDILVDANDQAVNIAKAFNKSIASASSPEVALALEKERSARLIANAAETTAALKSYDDQKAAPAREAAKQRLDALLAGYEQEQAAATAGEQRQQAALSAAHAMGIESETSYISAKQTLAENANIAQQAVVELELEAVQKSGLALKDRLAQETKYTAELQKLREQAVDIVQKADEDMAAADLKAFRAGNDQNAQYIEQQQAKAATLQEQVRVQQQANAEMGLSAVQINALRTATMELHAKELDLQATEKERLGQKPELIQALRDQATALRQLATATTAGLQKGAAIEEQKSFWGSIEQTAHSTFTSVTQGAQDMGAKVRDAIKSGIFEWLWQITAKRWFIDIQANVSGTSAGSLAQAASGGGGISSMFGSAGSLFGAGFNAGLGSIFGESGVMGGLSAGTTAIGAGNFLGGLGTLAGVAAPFLAGVAVISALAQGPTFAPAGSATVANVGASGASSVANVTYTQESGRGGTTINGAWADADANTTAYIDTAVKNITAANRAYGDAIGLNSAALDAYTAQLTINTSGMDAAAAQAAVDAALTQFAADQSSAAWGDALASVARDGETTSQTLVRLGTDLTAVNQVASFFGVTLLDVSVKGAAAASKLIDAFGSVDKFNTAASTFFKNYYTADEQRQKTVEGIQADLHKNGIDLSVEEIDKLTQEGVKAWVGVAETMLKAGTLTAEQFAAIINNANLFATYASSNTDAEDKEAQRKIDEEKAKKDDPSASDPWYWLFRGTQSYGGADGTTGGAGNSGPMGKGANGGNDGSSSSEVASALDGIKTWLENRSRTDQVGLDIFAQRTSAWAIFSTQMTLARGGDQTALGRVTQDADSLISAIEATSSSAFEQRAAVAKVEAQVGSLINLKPEDKVVSAIQILNGTLIDGFATLTGQSSGVFASGNNSKGTTTTTTPVVVASSSPKMTQVEPQLAYMPPVPTYVASPAFRGASSSGGGDSNADLAATLRAMADQLEAIGENTESAAISGARVQKMFERVMPESEQDVIAVQVVMPKNSFVPVRAV